MEGREESDSAKVGAGETAAIRADALARADRLENSYGGQLAATLKSHDAAVSRAKQISEFQIRRLPAFPFRDSDTAYMNLVGYLLLRKLALFPKSFNPLF